MIRVLALIAFVGFVVSVACLGAAAAIGGSDLAHHGWFIPEDWRMHVHSHGHHHDDDEDGDGPRSDGGGAPSTREIAWSGGEELDVNVPAEIRFTQAPGPGKLVVTGPKGSVDALTLEGGRLSYAHDLDNPARLVIVMTAPKVTDFSIDGSDRLVIAGFKQDRLHVRLNGSGDVSATGEAKSADADVAGSGEVDLGQLVADSVHVGVTGSGRAVIAPGASADVDVTGSGEVTLLTHPASMQSHISGSGRVTQAGPQAAASATSQPR